MKHFSKILLIVCLFIIPYQTIIAQEPEKTVTITVSGSGKTQDEAKQSALRSAIEQAFGAFITGKTEMLNDKVVSDQITSVANGNIQSFTILNELQQPDGNWGSTIKAKVSIEKLLSFVNARGANAEVNGGLFTLNIKQQAFNESGEVNAIYDMVGRVHELMQTAYDFKINAEGFEALDTENKNFKIPIKVTVKANMNMNVCADYIMRVLNGVSMSDAEKENYVKLKKKIYPVTILHNDKEYSYYLRKELSPALISSLVSNTEFYIRNFTAYRDGVELFEEPEQNSGNPKTKRKYILTSENDQYGRNELYNRYQYRNSSSDYTENSKIITFKLYSPTEMVANIYWADFKNIKEVEKIKSYTIKPNGVVSKFKEGGYVVYENNGHGLVVSLTSIGKADYKSAETMCAELSRGGYTDFRLPDLKELEMVADNLVSKYINSDLALSNGYKVDKAFWTTNGAYADSFIPGKKGVIFYKAPGKQDYKSLLSLKLQNVYNESNPFDRGDKLNILAVRSF